LFEQIGDAVRHYPRFSAPGTGEDQQRSLDVPNGFSLRWVEMAKKVIRVQVRRIRRSDGILSPRLYAPEAIRWSSGFSRSSELRVL
jgi:hypothetical protein